MKWPQVARADLVMLGILLPLALLAALVTWVLMPPQPEGGFQREPSTFYNVSYGTKAAYLVLRRLDYPVERLRRPISPIHLHGVSGLVLLKPTVGLSDPELSALKEWVKQGHRLLVAPGRSRFAFQPGSYLEEWFQSTEDDENGEADERTFRVGPRVKTPLGNLDPTAEGFDPNDPLCEGVGALTAGGGQRFVEGESWQGDPTGTAVHEVWKDARGIVALRVEYGSGEILALADPYPLTNLGISEADNAVFLANLARALAGPEMGAIAFDEFHLGKPLRDASWLAMVKLMLSGNWRWAVMQAALVGVLALFAAGMRFGSPRDVKRRERRQHREFAEAAGRLLYESGASHIAYQTLYHHYRNRLCRLVHRGADVANARLAEAVREAGSVEIGAVLREFDGQNSHAVSQQQLLRMCQELHRAVETLEHGT